MQITVSFRSRGTVIRKSGKLVTVDTKNIQIEEDDETITIEIENITKAHTLFNFEEALKKGPISEELQGESA
jgi:ribosome maturation factor RimP